MAATTKYLGYGGIKNSVAIKFDINNNAGEGNDSTGMYLNGATPTVPAIDLDNTGINLRSGDYMNVHMTYDGQNLNMTITDAITLASWSHSWAVNIPAQIGGFDRLCGIHRQYRRRNREPEAHLLDLSRRHPSGSQLSGRLRSRQRRQHSCPERQR